MLSWTRENSSTLILRNKFLASVCHSIQVNSSFSLNCTQTNSGVHCGIIASGRWAYDIVVILGLRCPSTTFPQVADIQVWCSALLSFFLLSRFCVSTWCADENLYANRDRWPFLSAQSWSKRKAMDRARREYANKMLLNIFYDDFTDNNSRYLLYWLAFRPHTFMSQLIHFESHGNTNHFRHRPVCKNVPLFTYSEFNHYDRMSGKKTASRFLPLLAPDCETYIRLNACGGYANLYSNRMDDNQS